MAEIPRYPGKGAIKTLRRKERYNEFLIWNPLLISYLLFQEGQKDTSFNKIFKNKGLIKMCIHLKIRT